jgi:DNA-binding transcriptional ArsR family regulator
MEYIYAPPTVKVDFSLEPVLNITESIGLLASVDELQGLNPWVEQTAKSLPPELKRMNDMVFSGANPCERPKGEQGISSYDEYLDWLASQTQDPLSMVRQGYAWLLDEPLTGEPAPELEVLLNDEDLFVQYIERWYRAKKAEKGYTFNEQLYRDIHPYLKKPAVWQQMVVQHLRTMWQLIIKPEWERKLPLLQEAVDAFQHMDYHNLTALEAIRAVTGRDVAYLDWKWGEHMIFVPSPHIGPYITPFTSEDGKTMRLLFGVRIPEGSRLRSNELSRSELNIRLSALADDTRLRILELVGQHGELCAQDIITMLDLSQSAASRNLRQLTATGYLTERRRETAKCYSLNQERVDDTLKALRRFLRRQRVVST